MRTIVGLSIAVLVTAAAGPASSAEKILRFSQNCHPYGQGTPFAGCMPEAGNSTSSYNLDGRSLGNFQAFLDSASFFVYTTNEADELLRKERHRADLLEDRVRVLQDMIRQMATTQDEMLKKIESLTLAESKQ